MLYAMLDAAHKKQLEDHEATSVSGSISFLEIFAGSAKASYENTHDSMEKWGLTEDQITYDRTSLSPPQLTCYTGSG
jgi:hypothetical protein